MKVKYEL